LRTLAGTVIIRPGARPAWLPRCILAAAQTR